MGYLGTKPANQIVDSTLIADGTVTPSDLSNGAPSWSQAGGVTLPRVDSSNEGGQLNFNRASDNTATWSIDSFGNNSTPSLRFIDGANVRASFDSSGNFQFNSGYGSAATAYGCRAWVNFNGSGGASIRASGNVASVTRSSVGVYFVTFTNSMPDVNFCFVGSASISNGNFGLVPGDEISSRTVSRTGTFYTTNTASVNNGADANNINIAIFR